MFYITLIILTSLFPKLSHSKPETLEWYPVSDLLSEPDNSTILSNPHNIQFECPDYLKIEECYNFDAEITVCYWDQTTCQNTHKSNYKLFYSKKSDKFNRIYTCETKPSDLDYYENLQVNNFLQNNLPKKLYDKFDQINYCILGAYDSQNIGTTYEFYVAKEDAFSMYVPKPNNFEDIYSRNAVELMVISLAPEISRISQVRPQTFDQTNNENLVTLEVQWLPPNNLLFQYEQIDFYYLLKYRKVNRKSSNDKSNLWNEILVPFDQMSFDIENLLIETSYEFVIQVKAVGSKNSIWSQESAVKSVYVSKPSQKTIDEDNYYFYGHDDVVVENFQSPKNNNQNLNLVQLNTTILILFLAIILLIIIVALLLLFIYKNRKSLSQNFRSPIISSRNEIPSTACTSAVQIMTDSRTENSVNSGSCDGNTTKFTLNGSELDQLHRIFDANPGQEIQMNDKNMNHMNIYNGNHFRNKLATHHITNATNQGPNFSKDFSIVSGDSSNLNNLPILPTRPPMAAPRKYFHHHLDNKNLASTFLQRSKSSYPIFEQNEMNSMTQSEYYNLDISAPKNNNNSSNGNSSKLSSVQQASENGTVTNYDPVASCLLENISEMSPIQEAKVEPTIKKQLPKLPNSIKLLANQTATLDNRTVIRPRPVYDLNSTYVNNSFLNHNQRNGDLHEGFEAKTKMVSFRPGNKLNKSMEIL